MTIRFMVLGGPRSATTWAANWLTTDTTFCLHDPLLEYTKRNLDILTIPGKEVGISCTSTLLFPEWFLKHPARKIILYREPEEVNLALEALGLAKLDIAAHNGRVHGAVKAGIELWNWDAVFDKWAARQIWKHLLPHVPFDEYRHDLLTQFNIQPQWRRLPVGKEAVAAHVKRVQEVVVHET
jgi:hypothetical protein